MRKILISLGSNKGGEFPTFTKCDQYDPAFEIFAFEPEPRCYEFIEEVQKTVPNITHIKKGASTQDGELTWRVGRYDSIRNIRSYKETRHDVRGNKSYSCCRCI